MDKILTMEEECTRYNVFQMKRHPISTKIKGLNSFNKNGQGLRWTHKLAEEIEPYHDEDRADEGASFEIEYGMESVTLIEGEGELDDG